MRSTTLALATTVVALTVSAGSAAAQTPQTPPANSSFQIVIQNQGGKPVIFSGPVGSTNNTSAFMEGIALTGSQRDALAKIDATHDKAVADADAAQLAAVRALLTPAQLDRFDKNQAAQKEQMATMEKMAQVNFEAVQGAAQVLQGRGQAQQGTVQIQVNADSVKSTDKSPAKSDK